MDSCQFVDAFQDTLQTPLIRYAIDALVLNIMINFKVLATLALMAPTAVPTPTASSKYVAVLLDTLWIQ